LLKAGKSHSRRKREAGHQTTLFLVTGSAFSLWLCRRLNFAAPRLVTMLFQPNGLVALFAAISRGQAIPKNTSLETGRAGFSAFGLVHLCL
jgi:hypothetical protein